MTAINEKEYPRLHILQMTAQLKSLMTIIRDKATRRKKFIFYSNRINRLLIEEALNFLPVKEKIVETRMGERYVGSEFVGKICAVPILRAGLSMEESLRDVANKVRIAHVLIQRDEKTAKPIFYKKWLPEDIKERYALILDPMLATGGSAVETIKSLIESGVEEKKMIFINLVSAPAGIDAVFKAHPGIRLITAEIDRTLDERSYILPGLGDFGDLYFGTN